MKPNITIVINHYERLAQTLVLLGFAITQPNLHSEDPTGYQFVQCRGLLVLESAIGKVAILPMGMAQVSSVVFVTPQADGHQSIVLTPKEKRRRNYQEQVELVNEKIHQALVGNLTMSCSLEGD